MTEDGLGTKRDRQKRTDRERVTGREGRKRGRERERERASERAREEEAESEYVKEEQRRKPPFASQAAGRQPLS